MNWETLAAGDPGETFNQRAAAGIWMTAAAGVAAGLGRVGLALAAVIFSWIVLAVLRSLEPRIRKVES